MANDAEYPERGYNTKDVAALREPRRPGRRWGLIALATLIVLPAALFALWTWITLSYAYSSGDRVGYAQKISQKGWLCKTWEGELAMSNVPGQIPEKFEFSVRDDAVARQIAQFDGQRVSVHYEQHRGVPTSCFGETEYFVTSVRRVSGP
jgi:hypothetical protein